MSGMPLILDEEAVRSLGLRLGMLLVLVGVSVLGQAEVHERTMPGVAERHDT